MLPETLLQQVSHASLCAMASASALLHCTLCVLGVRARLRTFRAAELVRNCSVECGAALSSSRSIAARRRGELVTLLSQNWLRGLGCAERDRH